MSGHPKFCPGPKGISRRSFLELGAYSACGLGLGDLLRGRASAAAAAAGEKSAEDTSVIFIWLPGGPPHMEMYDMKPDAPREIRGDFSPIRTNVPGIEVCELMPRHAKIADKYNIIRSVHHTFSDHGGGHKRFLTGRDPAEPTGFVNDSPMCGSYVKKVLQGQRSYGGVPPYVALIRKGRDNIDTFSFGSAWMGLGTHPFIVNGDPNETDFKIDSLSLDPRMEGRLEDRTKLLGGLDRLRREVDHAGSLASVDEFNRQALEMMTSEKVREAFDLSKEPEALRDRYGRHAWGQRALLSRRLVEAGSSFVTMVMENPYVSGIGMPKNGTYNWDSHAVNCDLFADARIRLPLYDQVITTLIEDLYDRGLDKKVLLVVTGEFGRTPKVSVTKGSQTGVDQPGRDHWPSAMSMLVSGGGMATGQVIGATNKHGEHPVERPLSPNDLWATMFRHLGIDHHQSFLNFQGRPMPILSDGEPIAELLPRA